MPQGKFSYNKGFTLVEIAIVMVITGLLLTAGIAIVRPIMVQKARVETQQKLDNIAKALDFYATRNFRIPCPALPDEGASNPPFGFERGSGVDGSGMGACTVATGEGIVPFRTLGLPEEWVKDAWDSYITYAVSPAFTGNPQDTARPVHRRCRTAEWFSAGLVYDSDINANPLLTPRNPRKARFCCSGAAFGEDLNILDADDVSQMAHFRQNNPPPDVNYAAADIPFPAPEGTPPSIPPNEPIFRDDRAEAPAYILISHGANRRGAYNGLGVAARLPDTGADARESENVDGINRTYYEIPIIDRAGVDMEFDDVVVWRSQVMSFAAQGESCSLP